MNIYIYRGKRQKVDCIHLYEIMNQSKNNRHEMRLARDRPTAVRRQKDR